MSGKLTLNKNHQKIIKKGPKLTNFLISDRMVQLLSLYLQPFQRYCHQKVLTWALYFPLYRSRFNIFESFLLGVWQKVVTYRQTNHPFRCSFWYWIEWWKLEVHRWIRASLASHLSSSQLHWSREVGWHYFIFAAVVEFVIKIIVNVNPPFVKIVHCSLLQMPYSWNISWLDLLN